MGYYPDGSLIHIGIAYETRKIQDYSCVRVMSGRKTIKSCNSSRIGPVDHRYLFLDSFVEEGLRKHILADNCRIGMLFGQIWRF